MKASLSVEKPSAYTIETEAFSAASKTEKLEEPFLWKRGFPFWTGGYMAVYPMLK